LYYFARHPMTSAVQYVDEVCYLFAPTPMHNQDPGWPTKAAPEAEQPTEQPTDHDSEDGEDSDDDVQLISGRSGPAFLVLQPGSLIFASRPVVPSKRPSSQSLLGPRRPKLSRRNDDSNDSNSTTTRAVDS